jgi:hypothetical protein
MHIRHRKMVSIDADELEELKRERDFLKKELAIGPSTTIKDLSEREKTIFNYIRKNPGIIKQRVVDWCVENGKGSRVTALASIKDLENYGMIYLSKDKPNSQIHKLFINNDSLLVTLFQELDDFKNVFFALVEKIIDKHLEHMTSRDSKRSSESKRIDSMAVLSDSILFYSQLINVYIANFILKWPKEIGDKKTLDKAFSIFFFRAMDMLSQLSEAIRIIKKNINEPIVSILFQYANDLFLLTPDFIEYILDRNEKFQTRKEVESVLDVIWKISFSTFQFTNLYSNLTGFQELSKGPEKQYRFEDWRHVLKYTKELGYYQEEVKFKKES